MTLKTHEQEIIRKLLESTVASALLEDLLASSKYQIEQTGAGYFISLEYKDLPKSRTVFDSEIENGSSFPANQNAVEDPPSRLSARLIFMFPARFGRRKIRLSCPSVTADETPIRA